MPQITSLARTLRQRRSAAASSGRSGIYQELGVGELADEEYALFRHIEKIYSDLAS